ncbi:MAG: hypothetical protein AB1670_07720 [Pseudomonadota bacterium]
MNRTLPLHYDTGPHDDTPSGHSFAAAWWTLTGFGVLSATLAFGLIGEAAIYFLF